VSYAVTPVSRRPPYKVLDSFGPMMGVVTLLVIGWVMARRSMMMLKECLGVKCRDDCSSLPCAGQEMLLHDGGFGLSFSCNMSRMSWSRVRVCVRGAGTRKKWVCWSGTRVLEDRQMSH